MSASAAGRLRAIASRLFDRQTMERVIEPILADLQCEYDEALARGLPWRARVSLVHSYFAFGSALISLGLRTTWYTDNSRSDLERTCLVSAVASAVVTVALTMPPLFNSAGWQRDPAFAALLVVTLVPQALPLSIPAGLCVAVMLTMRGKVVTWRRVGTLLVIGLAFTGVVSLVLEWMMPQANQQFRELVAARISNGRVVALEPGLSELGLSRLRQRSDPEAVRQYQMLWGLCFASVPLSLLAFGLTGYVRRTVWTVALATALFYSYFTVFWACAAATSGSTMPASLAAWTPNVIFSLVGCALLLRAPRPRTSDGPRAAL